MNAELAYQSAATEGDLSSVVTPLLKGIVYQESDGVSWNTLLTLQSRVRDFVGVLGLELILDEAEGYAFLKSSGEEAQDSSPKRPRLIARRPLSFPVSLLLALLRKKLAEFDASGGDTRLVLSSDQIIDLVQVFLPERTDQAKFIDQVETYLHKIVDLGFIRRLKVASGQEQMYEVRRILKAFVDAQWLAEFDARLLEYQDHLVHPHRLSRDQGAEDE